MTQTAAARRSTRQTRSAQFMSAASIRPAPPRRQRDFRYYVDRSGCQHFNFPQRIWLDPTIPMAVTPVQTLALETLAINLLTAVGVTSQRALVLSGAFCADCLLGAPVEAWELPRASIRAWLDSHANEPRKVVRCSRVRRSRRA
jgi:hypothetical protein